MNMTPKTIQIFLPGGDPRGIRIAEITTRIIQVIEIPRSIFQDFLVMPECDQVAIYFLIGESGEGASPRVYIGQTGDLRARLKDHNQKKDFWQRALVLISRTHSLTQTHALFLEWHCLKKIREAARYADENGNSGTKPHTPAPLESDCMEIFETGSTLLAILGYPLCDAVGKSIESGRTEEMLYCRAAGSDGRGLYTPEGFVVLKGSIGRRANVPSIVGTGLEQFREKLIESNVLAVDGETVAFTKDFLFGSPSTAASALLGRTANGWVEWKDEAGVTLDKLKRASADPS